MDYRLVLNRDRGSPTDSANACDTSPVAGGLLMNKLDKITLRNIAEERVDIISEEMQLLPDEYVEELKNSLCAILKGNDDSQEKKEFMALQKLVQARSDLTVETLLQAHRVQLEILVAMKMGTLNFLDPRVSRTCLVEIFAYKRCPNIACSQQLPARDCTCLLCANKIGFCNACMCVICTKFDNEVNTSGWIGCDRCSHWTHFECAIHDGLISVGTCTRSDQTGEAEMVFKCRACNWTYELLGWVKDIFQHCASISLQNRAALMAQLDIVGRIYRWSEGVKGKKLFWISEELMKKLKGGLAESTASRAFLMWSKGSHEHLTPEKEGLEEEELTLLHELKEAARLAEAKHDKSKKRRRDATDTASKDTDPIVEWEEGDDASNGGKRPNTSSKRLASNYKEATPQDISTALSVQPKTTLSATSLPEVPTSFLNGERGARALMLQTILHQVTPPADRENMKAESFDARLDNAMFSVIEGCLRSLAALEFTAQERATLESKVEELQKQFAEEQAERKKVKDELGEKEKEVSQLKQELIECRERFERFSEEEERLRVARARDLEAMKATLGSYLERELSYLGSKSQGENASEGDHKVN